VRRFFVSDVLEGEFDLPRDESRHLAKVLRARVGDVVELVDGRGGRFQATLIAVSPSQCSAEVVRSGSDPAITPQLTLAIAPTKKTDRLEWFLEKACEIGVTRVQPIWTRRSERRVEKPERWNRVLIEAMKQCQDSWLPELEPALDFKEFLERYSASKGLHAIAHCPVEEGLSSSSRTPFWDALSPGEDAVVCIGPEGDFAASEIESATAKGWLPVTFGDRRLRTETAALYAVQAFQLKQQSRNTRRL
jgi:16S rRNA (uracil1498-N3)-methyltransferase